MVCAVSLLPTPATTAARLPDRLNDGAQQPVLLVVAGGGRLAGGAADDQAVAALIDQMRGERLRAGEVERAVSGERGHHRDQHAAERAVGERFP